MANMCITGYVVTGNAKMSRKLWWHLNRCYCNHGRNNISVYDFIKYLGGDAEKIDGKRGTIYNFSPEACDEIVIDIESAWSEPKEFRSFLELRFPGIKIFYTTEEFGCDYWGTNDKDGDYFAECIYLRVDGEIDEPYFSDEELAADTLRKTLRKHHIPYSMDMPLTKLVQIAEDHFDDISFHVREYWED